MRKKWLLYLGAILVCGIGLNWLRLSVGGIHNLTSKSYWQSRLAGTDLYQPQGAILKHGNRSLPEVALTFDDGPHPDSLPLILDTLRRNGVHATFFLVGKRIEQSPELARQIVEEGHEVGNHTEDHLRLTGLKAPQVAKEVEDCELAFNKATGRQMSLLRPPGMQFNGAILEVLEGLGYTTIGWSAAAKDFETESHHIQGLTPDEISQRVISHVDNGGIILLHDTKQTADALPELITLLRSAGYRFVTIPEMLQHLPKPVLVRSNATSANHA